MAIQNGNNLLALQMHIMQVILYAIKAPYTAQRLTIMYGIQKLTQMDGKYINKKIKIKGEINHGN